MSKVKRIERQVQDLSPEELTEFREWFLEFDWQVWDRRSNETLKPGSLIPLPKKHFASTRRARPSPFEAPRHSELLVTI